ncbi:hypothetical protein BH11VER1_BH11VER1_11880 [soil metagenome]
MKSAPTLKLSFFPHTIHLDSRNASVILHHRACPLTQTPINS